MAKVGILPHLPMFFHPFFFVKSLSVGQLLRNFVVENTFKLT